MEGQPLEPSLAALQPSGQTERPVPDRTAAVAVAGLQSIWPWRNALEGCCCIAVDYDGAGQVPWNVANPGIQLPSRLHQAAKRRQAEYAAGRRCAGEALKQVTGVRHIPGATPDGLPDWPKNATGSISHSRGRAVAIAGSNRRFRSLGVDLEKTLSPDEAREIAPLVLDNRERAGLAALPAVLSTTLGFSLKESLFKTLGPAAFGFSPFEIARVTAWSPSGTAALELVRDLSAEWRRDRIFHLQWSLMQDFVLTLASVKNQPCETRPGEIRRF